MYFKDEEMEAKTKSIYIVLTRTNSCLSNAIHTILQDQYTHAAISLDSGLEYMFSFARRKASNPFVGCFKHECLDGDFYARHDVLPGTVLKLDVTENEYNKIAADIWHFVLNGHAYEFNVVGMFASAFGFHQKFNDNKFFCSEFVYYILHKNGICNFNKPRAAVRPQHLLDIKARSIFEGDLLEYIGSQSRCEVENADVLDTMLPGVLHSLVQTV